MNLRGPPCAAPAATLQRICDPSVRRVIVFNCRLFQEGVEIPALNGVFFAAPRFSPRDIIQSICRPLNKLPGKPPSMVFLPAVIDPNQPPDHPVNLQRFSTLVPFVDALMDEDPNLFEWLIDPSRQADGFDVLGVRAFKLGGAKQRQVLLSSLRRGVRYSATQTDRLSRATRLPWGAAFAELKRIVLECHRYPKGTDAWRVGEANIPISTFYKHCQASYQQYLDGDSECPLQPHQLRDLETLPCWTTRGAHGPYPMKECVEFLRSYLRSSGGEPPLVEINVGGYIGLDASPMERLSGFLTTVNQRDMTVACRVSAEEAALLDEISAEFGIKWRKPRDSRGRLITSGKKFYPTWIQQSNSRFRTLWDDLQECRASGAPMRPAVRQFSEYIDAFFRDYPVKHRLQEHPDVIRSNQVPPRLAMTGVRRTQRSLQKTKRASTMRVDPDAVHRDYSVCRMCKTTVPAVEWEVF